MALRGQHLDQLHASWDGTGFSLWALDGEEVRGTLVLRSLATMAFGYGGLALLGTSVTPLHLPVKGDSPVHAPSLRPFAENAYSFVAERHASASTSASLRWMYAAADLGVTAARVGLIAPALRNDDGPGLDELLGDLQEHSDEPQATRRTDTGLGWSARWRLRRSPALDDALVRLEQQAPAAVWAPFAAGPPPGTVGQVVEYFADGAARWALDSDDWRPDLGRSSRPEAVVGRRVAAALRGPPVVLTANAGQQSAARTLGLALDDHSASADAGVSFRCRARLTIPDDDQPDRPAPIPDPGSGSNLDPDSLSGLDFGGLDDPGTAAESAPWPVAFEVVLVDDPTVTLSWSDLAADAFEPGTTPGGVVVTEEALSVMKTYIDSLAATIAGQIPELADLDAERGLVLLDIDTVVGLLGDGVERCAELGCPLLVPKELARSRLRLAGKAKAAPSGGASAGLGEAMVDIDWGIALGEERLSDAEIAALAEAKSELIQLRGAWVRVDAGHVTSTLANLGKRRGDSTMTPAELVKLAASSDPLDGQSIDLVADGEDEGQETADGWLADLLAGLPDDRLQEAAEPDGFVGELRPYQRRAVGWLAFLSRLGLGGCLADDMGLGKTPTTLAHLVGHLGDRPSLVLCPLSVVHNWEAEAGKFAPGLRVFVAHGAGRKRGEALAEQLDETDLVISTYGTVTRDIEAMSEHRWNIVVCDEAQIIKNHRTKAARAVRTLEARQLVALTGTPVENRLSELWSILDAANPGSLGGIGWFRDTFATPIESKGDKRALAGMRKLTAPFVLRRTKADKSLVPDLPDKIEQVAWATLSDEQAGLYQAVLDDFLAEVEAAQAKGGNKAGADDGGGRSGGRGAGGSGGGAGGDDNTMQRRGLVLATLTRLKQICNHPAQFLAAGGEEPGRLSVRSGKLERFDELVAELLEADERALVFTQYREMGELLVRHLAQAHDVRAEFLHGGLSRSRRDEMVTDFQSGDSAPLQVVSLKAGGTGLNLTSASRVIHYDRWWNPAVEDQATDRAWRIGQRSTVFVHKLVCRGTLEERIDSLLLDKKALANSAVSTGEGWLTEMSTDELKGLFALGPDATAEPGGPTSSEQTSGHQTDGDQAENPA